MDFALARHNMVESQVRTNEVTDPRLHAALESVPREVFVPKALRPVAYVDEDIALEHGRHLVEPRVVARLLQAAGMTGQELVLDLACGTGWTTAVLSRLAATVVAVESHADLVARAAANLTELAIDNAAVVEGRVAEGYPEQAPFDVILLGGGVAEVPRALREQLADGGRLLTVVVGEGGVGRAVMVMRSGDVFSTVDLFDCGVPLVPEFRPRGRFVF